MVLNIIPYVPPHILTDQIGFDYNFNAIQDESNELFRAYKDMFEVAISQGRFIRTIISIYAPFVNQIFVSASFTLFLESTQGNKLAR